MTDIPSFDWLVENFKTKSAAVRYLHLEHNLGVKEIASHLGLPYRVVYGVVRKAKLMQIPQHICPVCMNRKG